MPRVGAQNWTRLSSSPSGRLHLLTIYQRAAFRESRKAFSLQHLWISPWCLLHKSRWQKQMYYFKHLIPSPKCTLLSGLPPVSWLLLCSRWNNSWVQLVGQEQLLIKGLALERSAVNWSQFAPHNFTTIPHKSPHLWSPWPETGPQSGRFSMCWGNSAKSHNPLIKKDHPSGLEGDACHLFNRSKNVFGSLELLTNLRVTIHENHCLRIINYFYFYSKHLTPQLS